jgi:magnesium chelatase family protein
MSLAVIHSRGLVGVEAPSVSVEVHLANGLPAFHVVGLPDAEVRESRERVRAALLHSGFEFPNRRITVNLAPADLPKGSGRFDLPIAIGILAAAAGMKEAVLERWEMMGELSLTGALRPVRGALVLALAVRRHAPGRLLVLPAAVRTSVRKVALEASINRPVISISASTSPSASSESSAVIRPPARSPARDPRRRRSPRSACTGT